MGSVTHFGSPAALHQSHGHLAVAGELEALEIEWQWACWLLTVIIALFQLGSIRSEVQNLVLCASFFEWLITIIFVNDQTKALDSICGKGWYWVVASGVSIVFDVPSLGCLLIRTLAWMVQAATLLRLDQRMQLSFVVYLYHSDCNSWPWATFCQPLLYNSPVHWPYGGFLK